MRPSDPSRPRAICGTCHGTECVLDHLTFEIKPCPVCSEPPPSWRDIAVFYACALVVAAVSCAALAGLGYAVANGWIR